MNKNDNGVKMINAKTEAFHANEYPKEIIALVTKKRRWIKGCLDLMTES